MIREVELEKIRIDGGTQMRVSIDTDAVTEYAECLDDLPPPDLFFDGTDYWLADGFHRYHAHRQAGKKGIRCKITKGTLRDAILFAASANQNHGLRRTNADKRKTVQSLLNDKEWAGRSDRWIAEQAHVSRTLVDDIRSQLAEKPVELVSRDGKSRPAPTRKHAESEEEIDLDFTTPQKPARKGDAPKDQVGNVIEDKKLIQIFERRQELVEMMSTISKLRTTVEKASDGKDPLFIHFSFSQWKADCGNLYRAVRFAAPHALCPYCRASGCKLCKGTGFVGEEAFKNYVPEDLK